MSEAIETKTDNSGDLDGLMARLAETEPARLTVAFFQELCATHTEAGAIHAALRSLARQEATPSERRIAEWLTKNSAYLAVLFDPELLTLDEGQRAAVNCRRHDTRFLARVQQFLTSTHRPVRLVVQALGVLDVFQNDSTLVPLLRTLTHHESERVRSHAAKVLCKLRPNRNLVERQLQSYDPRTRANALEGLWGIKTMEAEEIFRMAASDVHHRVAVNALIGLYYQNDPTALDRLIGVARHRSPVHRAAAIWAFRQLQDPRAIPALQTLLEDPRIFVRKKAAAVLEQLQSQSQTAAPEALPEPQDA